MPKSESEKCDETEMPEDDTRRYASSPCSLHELDAEFWPVRPEDESDGQLPQMPDQDSQKPG